jgi:electron transfer flavoprotein alpha subunit
MAVLIVAKHDNAQLNDATARSVTAARALGGDIAVLVAGENCAAVAQAAARLDGVGRVLHVEGAAYGHRLAEPLTELVKGLAADYEHLVFPATTSGKNVAPRLAALLDVMVISDITGVLAPDTFERPIYAGNAVQTVQSTDAKASSPRRRSRPRRPPPTPASPPGSRTRSRPPTGPSSPRRGSWSPAAAASAPRRTSR